MKLDEREIISATFVVVIQSIDDAHSITCMAADETHGTEGLERVQPAHRLHICTNIKKTKKLNSRKNDLNSKDCRILFFA